MASPRVLQAQIQDLLDAYGHDARFTPVVEALQGALEAVPGATGDDQPSPGRRAARGENDDRHEQRRYEPEPDPRDSQPRSFRDARQAAEARFAEGAAAQ